MTKTPYASEHHVNSDSGAEVSTSKTPVVSWALWGRAQPRGMIHTRTQCSFCPVHPPNCAFVLWLLSINFSFSKLFCCVLPHNTRCLIPAVTVGSVLDKAVFSLFCTVQALHFSVGELVVGSAAGVSHSHFSFQLSPLCMQQLSPQSKPNLLSTIYSVPAIAPGIAALPQHPTVHKPAQCSQSKICSYSLLSLHGTASVIVVSSICTYTALSGHFWKFSIFFL